MDWKGFLTFIEKHDDYSFFMKLLKGGKLQAFSDSECSISLENPGSKIYLDGKRAILEQSIHDYTGKSPTLVLTVQKKPKRTSKKKKEKEESKISILQFQGKQENKIKSSGLQPRFTFENFAVSPTNHMAYAAAQAVEKNPGIMYNPLFIYGGVGVGKTHLSQAILNIILEKDLRKKVLYCTSEQFTNDLVEAIRSKNTKNIRNKYRNLDALIIDDIQFIAGKNYVQEEFYHTFNTIVQNGGQIILASDRPPQEIKALEDRLRSRFSGGLIIDMQSPDFELRTAIVLIKAKERNIDIDMKAAQEIAEKITDSRELEGALLKLLSLSLIQEESNKITADAAVSELKRQADITRSKIRPQDIIASVASYYDLKPSHIKGSSRKQQIAFARQVAMYLLRIRLGLNLDEVAFMVKRKDHTTIIHGVNKIEDMMIKDKELRDHIQRIYESTTVR